MNGGREGCACSKPCPQRPAATCLLCVKVMSASLRCGLHSSGHDLACTHRFMNPGGN